MTNLLIVEKLIKAILKGDCTTVSKGLSEPINELGLAEIIKIFKANRLEPFLFASMMQFEDEVFGAWIEDRKKKSLYSVAASYRIFNKGLELITALDEAQIDHFALRGPFDAAQLYGDIAAREYGDIDIFVRPEDTEKAWAVAEKMGFGLYHDEMTKGFFRRHHLNWALVNTDSKVMCDLHWAVDHPYRSITIDYGEIFDAARNVDHENQCWKSPSLEHWLILNALHLRKHCANILELCQHENPLAKVLATGEARYLVDTATFIKKNEEEINWGQLVEIAERWNAVEPLAAILMSTKNILELSEAHEVSRALSSWEAKGCLAVAARPSTFPFLTVFEQLAGAAGFNASRGLELKEYVLPVASSSGKPSTIRVFLKLIHMLKNSSKLSYAIMDCFFSYIIKRVFLQFSSKKRVCKDVRGNAVYV